MTLGGAILRPQSLVCEAHFAPCVLVWLAHRHAKPALISTNLNR
jgi:hypothetical protein